MKKRTLILSVIAASLMLAGPSFAHEKKKDAMMKDKMETSGTMMKKDGMKKDAMMKNGMKKDKMMKKN